MICRKDCNPPMATSSAPTQTMTIPAKTAPAVNNVGKDLVPSQVDTIQSGNKKAIRSGRKPLPIPRATAPQIANCFSPFQQRQQQYAVKSENNARFGRNGPSRAENQKIGFTSKRNAAAAPAHTENIRLASTNPRSTERALTRMEIAINVRSGARKT